MDVLPEPLLWTLLAVGLTALVVTLTATAMRILRRRSPDQAMRTRLQRTSMIASAIGMLAVGTITMAILASNV